jgi:hypothetical protein
VSSRVVPKKFAQSFVQSKVFCGRALDGPLLAPVYAGSGWTAFREQVLWSGRAPLLADAGRRLR